VEGKANAGENQWLEEALMALPSCRPNTAYPSQWNVSKGSLEGGVGDVKVWRERNETCGQHLADGY